MRGRRGGWLLSSFESWGVRGSFIVLSPSARTEDEEQAGEASSPIPEALSCRWGRTGERHR